MRTLLALIAFFVASPAAAEHITAYWQLENSVPGGPMSIDFGKPFLEQRMLPVKLVRLKEAAAPAGATEQVAAGTVLYLVVNDSGKTGYCTLKDRKGAAKSLFIPALDKRPCFVDRDGDGRFDASFSVFDIYSRLSPPQPRGNLDSAQPMSQQASYEQIDVHQFPDKMTLSYRLTGSREKLERVKLEVTLDRPGRYDLVDVKSVALPAGPVLEALGMVLLLKSFVGERVNAELALAPRGYVYGEVNGIIFVRDLPSFVR